MEQSTQMILGLVLGIAVLIYLSMKTKVHTFIALIIAALITGLIGGLGVEDVMSSITKGFGNTLSSTGIIVVFLWLVQHITRFFEAIETLFVF